MIEYRIGGLVKTWTFSENCFGDNHFCGIIQEFWESGRKHNATRNVFIKVADEGAIKSHVMSQSLNVLLTKNVISIVSMIKTKN